MWLNLKFSSGIFLKILKKKESFRFRRAGHQTGILTRDFTTRSRTSDFPIAAFVNNSWLFTALPPLKD
jgi:hypothetical protein